MARTYLLVLFTLFSLPILAQQVDLENIDTQLKEKLKKKPFSILGSASVSGVYNEASDSPSSEPFLYFFNGNITLGFYDWTMPINYRYTNQGDALDYQIPFKFNRLSLHPKYKWILAHIGDVSMSFSPYTFNGLQFTGGGLELTPEKYPLRASFMGGRLAKATEYDGRPQTIPTYERWGYGTKLSYKKEDLEIGGILFFANDKANSLSIPIPDEKKIYPLSNQVYSGFAKYKPLHFVEVFGEYALSLLGNTQSQKQDFTAYNAGINFIFTKASVGVRYEKVDPDYKTLGAYYFVNDMENITLNSSLNLFKGNVSIATSIGRQHDNLNQQKPKQSNQWVGSANVNAKVTPKLSLSGSYSNFTMFTNKLINPFDRINNPQLYEHPQDSINYRQVSQNTNANIAYAINEKQNITLSYSFNDVVNKQNDIVRRGGISRFHNAGAAYMVQFPESKLSLSPSFNYSYSIVAREKTEVMGPSLTVGKTFFEDKLNTTLLGNYSISQSATSKGSTANVQLNLNFLPWKNHQFTLSALQSFRNAESDTQNTSAQSTNVSVGYTYHFEKVELPFPSFKFKKKEKTPKEKKPRKEKKTKVEKAEELEKSKDTISLQEEKVIPEASTMAEEPIEQQVTPTTEVVITKDIPELSNITDLSFMGELNTQITEVHHQLQVSGKKDRKRLLQEQKLLIEKAKKQQQDYRGFVFRCLKNIYQQAVESDSKIKGNILSWKQTYDSNPTNENKESLENAEKAYQAHLWMLNELKDMTMEKLIREEGLLSDFAKQHKEEIYEALAKKISPQQKINIISESLIDFYHKAYLNSEW
ncbi:TonB-dependent receptor [Capnocytophaga genosp. AHN8471]|uniref:TonB-dependent receptor n=1 Tax=Capnocytophaga genosp. AHN8471 TaxID=327574 RepID=UPI001932BB6E|nr:TonB-dependent receptor [Capnocytophaga genosp. AHN8471]MBM0656162.1 TonB-dependent receptor [Capnocytophaga genosp. AHN8471]